MSNSRSSFVLPTAGSGVNAGAVSSLYGGGVFTASCSGTTLTVTAAVGALYIGAPLPSPFSNGTVITGFGNNTTGGVGTYTLNNAQTVASTPGITVAPGTFIAPMKASIIEPEAGMFATLSLTTTYGLVSALATAQTLVISTSFTNGVSLLAATNPVRIAASSSPATNQWTEIPVGVRVPYDYNRFSELYLASSTATATLSIIGC
jgi:hypothetical protein